MRKETFSTTERTVKVMNLFECDFCGSKSKHLYPINGGLWAICYECMDYHYDPALVDHAKAGEPRGEEE